MTGRRLIVAVAVALFAISLALAGGDYKCKASTQECLDKMAAKFEKSGFVGVELDTDKATGGYAITRIIPGSPAEKAGLKTGDVLFALNGVRMAEDNHKAMKKAKKDWTPGQEITYTIKRGSEDREVQLTLAPMPADVLAQWIGHHMLEHAQTEIAKK
jgi:C-terminal processing protease CtpA/Prc